MPIWASPLTAQPVSSLRLEAKTHASHYPSACKPLILPSRKLLRNTDPHFPRTMLRKSVPQVGTKGVRLHVVIPALDMGMPDGYMMYICARVFKDGST
jgi:hypothetical protein